MPVPKGTRIGGRKKNTPNKATFSIKLMLGELLHDTRNRELWNKWLTHKDPKYRWEAFKLAQAYMFGKPVQPIVGDEDLPPVRIDISAIPMKREKVS